MKKSKIRVIFLTTSLLFFNSVFAAPPAPLSASAGLQKVQNPQKKPQLLVRDYKYFREFNYGGAKLLVNKSKSGARHMLMTRGQATLSVVQNQDTSIYEYMVPSQKKRHYLVYKIQKNKKTKVAYYTVDRTKYFNESAMPKAGLDDSGQCSRGPNWSVGDLRDIAKAIGQGKENVFLQDNGFDPSNLIDENTCQLGDTDFVKESVEQLFEDNGAKLIACLQSDAAIKKLETDKALLANANLFVSRMISFVDVAQDKSEKFKNYNQALNAKTKVRTPIKIKCELDKEDQGKGKTACFNDLAEQPELRLNLKDPPIKVNGKIDKAALQKSIVHELIHASGQQMQIKPTPNCVDELIVKSLEGLCAEPAAVPKVEAGIEKCAADKGLGAALAGNATATDGGINDINVAAAIIQHTSDIPVNNIVDTKPVSNSEVAQLANATLPQSTIQGERVTVPESSPVASSFGTVFDQLSNSMTGMGKVVATAAVAAGTISAAVAQTNTAPSVSNTQSPTATVTYPLSQVAADKYSSNLQPTSSEVTESTRLASALNSLDGGVKANSNPSTAQATAKAAANQSAGTDAVANTVGEPTAGNKVAAGTSASRQIASVSDSVTAQNTGSVQAQTRSNDNQIVNQLFVVDSLAGNKYSEIKNKYSDPDFIKKLDDLGISIEIRSGAAAKKIGAVKNTRIKFVDNGQVLKKIDQ